MIDECSRCCQCLIQIFLVLTFLVYADSFSTQATKCFCLGPFSSFGSRLGPQTKGKQGMIGKKFPWKNSQPLAHGCWWINILPALPLVEGWFWHIHGQLEPSLPTVATCFLAHPARASFPSLSHWPMPLHVLPSIPSWVNYLCSIPQEPLLETQNPNNEKWDKEVKKLKVLMREE